MSSKSDYDFYKSIGICVRCHKVPAEPHKVMCLECSGRENDRYKEKGRCETTLRKDSQRKKIHYERCKADGICPRCGRKVEENKFVYCRYCRLKMEEYRRKNRKTIVRFERTSYEICYICGKNPVLDGKGVCEECYKVRLSAMGKCNSSRKDGFNDYWNKENNLVFGGKRA